MFFKLKMEMVAVKHTKTSLKFSGFFKRKVQNSNRLGVKKGTKNTGQLFMMTFHSKSFKIIKTLDRIC